MLRIGILGMLACFLAAMGGHDAARANWFTKILKEAGEAGGDAARVGSKLSRVGHGALGPSFKVIKKLPERRDKLVLGAHATPEGHWTFVNQKGDVYTAGTPSELARLETAIAPEGLVRGHKLAFYITEETVFERGALLKDLPPYAELHVISGETGYRLLRSSSLVRSLDQLVVQIRKKVHVVAANRAAFREAVWQLNRPLRKADVRILSLQPGASTTLSSWPRFDKVRKIAMVDKIDPDGLLEALPGVRGQTVLVTGRVEGQSLVYPVSGFSEGALSISALREAAAKADVNLVIMHASTTRQPGGRNWLWQRVEVDGLSEALKRATYADFLDALGAGRGTYRVTVKDQAMDRVHFEVIPDSSTVPVTETVSQWAGEVISSITGEVVIAGLDADLRSMERQKELDARLIPGIPSDYQIMYFVALVFGLFGWSMSRRWWRAIWRQDGPDSYQSTFGYFTSRVVEWLLYLFVFLPIVGIPAFVVTIIGQFLTLIMMPYWFVRWLFGLVARKT